jgi:hypothetical protein
VNSTYITIGNSDDKLTQREWSRFYGLGGDALRRDAIVMHGGWLSAASAPWQNACWCVELEPGQRTEQLKAKLGALAAEFGQDSIAWAEAPSVEFLAGVPS